ncbi:dnaJ homolog subfamily C member 16 [Coccinella septempunctata]|uniref:dnaJ homolog subfamily C member 16 n=1 Tax=Coccinella septempunctata TaxID=41139 RepID=UPI001D05CFD1|nr:dnaJ homolog subfamily C member 16 [Coccinella septempunctata]
MKWVPQFWFFQSCIIILCLVRSYLGELQDPYKILGIHRKASSQDIRRAYLQLVKSWHPDKSNDPSASEKFVQIKQAYELLSDPERRKRFDLKGITEDDFHTRPERSPYPGDPFEEMFSHHNHFSNQENDITFFHKLSINSRQYEKQIVPKSSITPYLIFFYTDWCFPCLQAVPHCRKLIDHLEPLGINFVTVHSARELNLARKLSIHTLPCLVLLLDGNSYVFKDSVISLSRLIEFIRQKMPYKLVPKIKEDDLEEFLSGWEDNKVRGLIFEPRGSMRLRYLVTAYHFRYRVSFGFADSDEIRSKFQVPYDMDTVLLFNENTSRPMTSVSMKDIPTSTLHHIISSNQYLTLPRLSSQEVFEGLCPCEWHRPRKKLCVILVTEESSKHNPHREALRTFAQNSPYGLDKVRFAYIYHGKQMEFVNSLIPEGSLVEPMLRIVILWRRDVSHVKYEWLNDKWESNYDFNDSFHKLESSITRLLKANEALSYEGFIKALFDEHAKGIWGRIFTRVIAFIDSLYDGIGKEQILPIVSVIGTVLFILLVGYLMAYLVRLEEEDVKKRNANSGNNNNELSNYQPELKLHELRAEKYNGLLRLLKPGCRTILLILDMQSRQQLIPPFHKAMWPYRKNKSLMFAYMYIERGLSWYKELLQLALPEDSELAINPRNCVGTVLALNGHRKYFCMFHAKHSERNGKKGHLKSTKSTPRSHGDPESGAFIGFDSSSESDEEVLLEGNLLDGLPNWLDRLFEGLTRRYHFNYWPDFPNK